MLILFLFVQELSFVSPIETFSSQPLDPPRFEYPAGGVSGFLA